MRTGDAVEIVNELDADDAVAVIAQLSHDDAIRLLDQPELHRAAEIVAALQPGLASLLLDGYVGRPPPLTFSGTRRRR